jgi:hypothetical protein
MPDPTQHTTPDKLRVLLEDLARHDRDVSPALSQGIRALQTAMDYEDPTLIRSSFNAILESFQNLVEDSIQRQLGRPQLLREFWRKIWEVLRCQPLENVDELGKQIKDRIDKQLENLTSLRDGPVRMLQARGYPVENAQQLDRAIADVEELKAGIFENWPWSNQALPAVDREMVAESRAAIARGEGERMEDLIRR